MDSSPNPRTNLANCDNEPIRYLAAIQPHGALLVLGRSSKIIEAASASCQTWLGLSASHLLGQTLGQVFGPAFEAAVLAYVLDDLSPFVPLSFDGRSLTTRSFCNDTGQIVVDIEPLSQQASSDLSYRCRLGLQTLRRCATESALTQAATDLIRTLTGFDQVMIYRFDADWNAQVVAKSDSDNMASHVGHHVPAGDMPAQPHEWFKWFKWFKQCRVHVIPDVRYVPSALHTAALSGALDLGRSSLRSVSPLHMAHLQDIGVQALLMGALVVNGRLWGLVSCQHKNAPRFVTPTDREDLAWLCEDIATLIEARWIQKQREREQEHYKAAQHIALMGSWEWEMTTGVVTWSDQQCRIFGYAPGKVHPSYDLFHMAVHPDDRAKVMEALENAISDLAPYDVAYRIVLPDRSIRDLHSLASLDLNFDGTPVRMVGTTLDITQRVQTQQRLESLLAKQKILLNNRLVGIAEAQNLKIMWANPVFESMLGYEPGELIGVEIRRGCADEEVWCAFGAVAYLFPLPGDVFRMEVEFVRKDKRTIWVDLSGAMMDAASDTSLWCYVDITEQKRLQQLILDSERQRFEQLDKITASVPGVVYRFKVEPSGAWSFLYLSAGIGLLYELSPEEAYRDPNAMTNCLVPEDRASHRAAVEHSFRSLSPWVHEHRIQTRSGILKWVRGQATPELQADGSVIWNGILTDITERKQEHENLQRSQTMLARTEGRAHIGSWEWDVATDNVTWSEELFRIFQRDPHSGAPSLAEHVQLYDPQDLQRLTVAVDAAVNHGTPYELELRAFRNDGCIRTCLARGHAEMNTRTHNGRASRLFGSLQDITERKQADAERERLHTIIEESPEFIAITDMQARHIYLNKAGARMVGLPENVDLSTLEIKHMHPPWATRRVMEEAIPLVIQEGLWQGENALLHCDGGEIPVSQLLLVHRDAQGKPEYLSTIMRDISRQKTSQIELTRAKEAAEAANLSKSRFLATMSHEIRTPMNGILGMAQLLLMSDVDKDEREDYSRTILSSGRILLTLLNDILDLSKIESGKVQLESIAFEPARLIHQTNTLFLGTAHANNLQLQGLWHGPLDQRYLADVHRVQQMLSNLASNAIKFTHQGSVRIEGTEISREGQTALLEFSVTDTGIGIAPDKINLLFKPFSQTDSSTTREFGGTGLGLSIVSQLARMMGGDVGIESKVGKGSRFWFRLQAPCVTSTENAPSEWVVAADTDSFTDSFTDFAALGKRVLLAEDNAINCMLMDAFLSKLGVGVTLTHNGKQTVDAATQSIRPDLVLMDLHMPVMDGYIATRQIRQWEATHHQPRLPIIALTADAYEEDHQHCLAVDMDGFLTKPIVLADLKFVLSQWLSTSHSQASAVSSADHATVPLDRPRFVAQVLALLPLLEHHLFDALAGFKDLQTLTAHTPIAADVAEISALLDAFRFDPAQERLRALAAISDPTVHRPLTALAKPQILMIDDMPVNMLTLGTALAGEYALQIATSGAEGLTLAEQSPPCLILLDVMMPTMSGFETIRHLKDHPVMRNIPVVFVTAVHETESEATGLSLGAVDYITKPIDVDIARQRIRNLVERERLRLQVEQQRDQLRKLSVAVEQSPALVVITDVNASIEYVNPRFTQATGYRAEEAVGKNPRFLQSGQVSPETYQTMWQQLTCGQIWHGELVNCRKNGEVYWEDTQIAPIKSLDGIVTHYVAVKTEITERKRLEAQIRDLAFYDALTHLANRRLLDDRLGQTIAVCKRNACHAAAMVLDLDNFKPLNDQHGHLVGDLLLMEAARRLGSCVRQMDTVARFGGDEFVVILGELGTDHAVSVEQAMVVAEKIRATLSQAYLLHVTQPDGTVVIVDHHCTASIGVVVFFDHETPQTDILKWADSAMYLAKDAGRNAIRLFEP